MKLVMRIFISLLFLFFTFQNGYAQHDESPIITLTTPVIIAASKCPYSLSGTWLTTNLTPEDYETFITFGNNGAITELGIFNVILPAGSCEVRRNCAIQGTFIDPDRPTEESLLTGQLLSNTQMTLTIGQSDPIDLIKVSDIGACRGTWRGTLHAINGPLPPSSIFQFSVTGDGTVRSLSGLAGPGEGKMYCQSGKGVMHIGTGEQNDYNELHLDGTVNGNTIRGIYGIDFGDNEDPDGGFSITRQ